jgi:hypothetical protein
MPDIKISDATPIGTLDPTDLLPIARVGTNAPYNASLADIAAYVTVLASTHPPEMSDMPPTAGIMDQYARADHVHPPNSSLAKLDSPEFVGHPTAPTMPPTDSSNAIATTRFVHDLGASGTLRTQTAGIDDNSELVATTEFVLNQAWTLPPLMDGVATAGTSLRFSRGDHTHPTDMSRAAFNEIPVAATTLPPMNGPASAGVGVTFARADHVHPHDDTLYPTTNPAGYQTANQVTVTLQAYAYRDSPQLIGIPTAPTPVPTDSSTTLATTAFVRTGTKTADTPPAGQIGEYLFNQVLQSAPVSLTSGQTVNVTQITLSAGDWGVSGNVGFAFTGGGGTLLSCGINTVSAQIPTGGTAINMIQLSGNISIPATNMPIPATRILLAAPAIIYLVASGTFTGTGIVYGSMNARRSR